MPRSPLEDFLAALGDDPYFRAQIVHHETTPPGPAAFAELDPPLPGVLRAWLDRAGITNLYTHQAEAVEAVRRGEHVVLSTPTASGKSAAYNLPVVERMLAEPAARALYLFPLKALARDQLQTLQGLLDHAAPHLTAAVYDGDTPEKERRVLRAVPPSVLLTNPEMLHLSLLPHHHLWAEFFRNLRFVIVDEVHTYRGVMGSHMAWVFRRLRRICAHYGARPAFIFCSATIANPARLASDLTGVEVRSINASGAPCGPQHMVMVSPLEGAARMAVALLTLALPRNIRTIVYTQSRKMTELISLWAGSRLGPLKHKITAYRAGYLPSERRRIEAALSSGETLGVISTSALELGIDIGCLDLCLLVGYPGSAMATRQRSGRVGRTCRDSAVIFLGHEDALDHYFLRHPRAFLDLKPEAAVINPANPAIRDRHLVCAAADLPLTADGDDLYAGHDLRPALRRLTEQGVLLRSADMTTLFPRGRNPQRDVDLRGAGNVMTIFDRVTRALIGSVDTHRAHSETHPGAVYLHRGRGYVIDDLDPETLSVHAEKREVDYFTRARQEKETEILETIATVAAFGCRVYFGRLRVTSRVTGYEKRLVRGGQLIGVVPLDLPPRIFETEGFWLEISDALRREAETGMRHFMGGIHALEHAMIGLLPLLVLADRNDFGGISMPLHPQVESAAVFVYDAVPGGVGLSRQAFDQAERLLRLVSETIRDCPCDEGCPACVHSPKCGSGNRPMDKACALFLLETLIRLPAPRVSPPSPRSTPPRDDSQASLTGLKPETVQVPAPAPGSFAASVADAPAAYGSIRFSALVARADYAPRVGVFDLETRNSAEDVGGWRNIQAMEVSCAVLHDSLDDAFHVFTADQIPSLIGMLQDMDLVVGFNIERFDYTVLSGYSRFDFWSLPTLDMLKNIHSRLGYRLKLDHLARHTLGSRKSADGLQALQWWKEGRLDDIAAYCTEDVRITRDLYRFGRDHGHVLFRNKAKQLVRLPVDWAYKRCACP